ncbi:anti-phage dCTP deaminase [Benzoatithermus flavus]|uniref:Anti-phage dCTP deaminase n=1 Tax=Benzoatithermus flavus TaxID=3108223 RepID=A0ABU8XY70_9PROT
MNLKFTGTPEELRHKLSSLGGEWSDGQSNKMVLRLNGGVLNWFISTGTLQFQGRSPGLEQLQTSVPHLLYPEEYKEHEVTIAQAAEVATGIKPSDEKTDTPEGLYLQGKFQDTELVIGIVNAVGTEYMRVLGPLIDRLQGFGYAVKEIRVSDLLPRPDGKVGEYDRIKHYMKHGDELRNKTRNNAILAAGAAHKIKELRESDPKKTAYIVNSLKHPDEVEFLRKVYGEGFYLFGIHADEKRRHTYLVHDKSLTQVQAEELIRVDEDEKIEHGQRTRDTFHLSDFFISLGKNNDQVKNTIQRFLELLFSNPFRSPTFDEFAMFMAFNSSIRSSDLSRQVGAIIARNQQILATGANDTPKFGGGQYWAEVDPATGEVYDVEDGKDYKREKDSNKAAQQEIIHEIVNTLIEQSFASEERRRELESILAKSKISNLTEFGRVVHAEMEAILSCARVGISTLGATLYCTTFPCHNCAKHIIDAGIKRVVYVEPYPKSRALDLHSEAISLRISFDEHPKDDRVLFEPFTGVGARRFLDLFSMSLGGGSKLKRKDKTGRTVEWSKENAVARTPLLPKSYLDIEKAASDLWEKRAST